MLGLTNLASVTVPVAIEYAAPLPIAASHSEDEAATVPVAYTKIGSEKWAPFASLVLEAAYEATLLAALLNKERGGWNVVLLTHLGGGALGNKREWIANAIRRALLLASN